MDSLTITPSEQTQPIALTILHLAGRLDASSEPALREQAERARANRARRLLLDLEKLDFISSAGLRAVQILYKMFTPAEEIKAWKPGGDVYKTPYFKIYCPSPQVYGVFNLAGFLHNIPFFTDRAAALASFE